MDSQNNRDSLLPYIKDEYALQILQEEGYFVQKGVLSREDCIKYVDGLWDFVESVSPVVKRTDPETQYKKEGDVYDPWPQTAVGLFHTNGVGWCQAVCDIREQVSPVFEKLYGTQQLHCSRDGINFSRPPRNIDECQSCEPRLHVDQGPSSRGLQCIQASVCLIDQQEGDGCFVCLPGSHKYHDEIFDEAGKGQRSFRIRDFYQLQKEEQEVLCKKTGQQPKCIYAEAGDMILWRSDLAHCGQAATKVSDRYRAVAFVCMLPASMTPNDVLQKKQQTWQDMYTTTHWPNKESWFRLMDSRQFNKGHRPTLTLRQKQLFGLEPYDKENEPIS
eukprot:TRINITY_DN1302_c1_g1_i2.p1 TRINITY_DN1302_c1_g1~~TRINITY_DN1302_c1_g1_i2.p1  ORF type:complete len:374 (-),score=20.48 TRINITY_DN1302_c1_g1_i2:1507-2499(-)